MQATLARGLKVLAPVVDLAVVADLVQRQMTSCAICRRTAGVSRLVGVTYQPAYAGRSPKGRRRHPAGVRALHREHGEKSFAHPDRVKLGSLRGDCPVAVDGRQPGGCAGDQLWRAGGSLPEVPHQGGIHRPMTPAQRRADGLIYFTPCLSRAGRNSSPGFQVGNCSALATARATSRVNWANTTKPEKSQSCRNSSWGEWYA